MPPNMDRHSKAGRPPGEQARKIFVFDSIADEMAVEQAVHKSATEFGGIGIIINNAGTVAPDDSVSAANGLLKTAKPPRTSSSITVTRDVSIESRGSASHSRDSVKRFAASSEWRSMSACSKSL